MIKLKDIFSPPHRSGAESADRAILFEEGLWCLYKRTPADMSGRYHIIHRCTLGTNAVNVEDNSPQCNVCNAAPSDGIVGLLKLQRWGSETDAD
ncbi:hypothetical protein LCGC14_0208160 [marine sediment metagenome]|uniref:Uncharacterized protein n=1 Tax=marine sediment metagenome TaxID=412755 RepID=A0A0F9UGJ4_9ZZZZ